MTYACQFPFPRYNYAVNSTAICRDSCTPSLTSLTLENELSTCLVSLYSDASTTKLLSTRWTNAHQLLTSFSASIFIQPAVVNFPCQSTGFSTCSIFHWLLHCLELIAWRPLCCADSRCGDFYFCSISVSSTLEVNYENALYNLYLTLDISSSIHKHSRTSDLSFVLTLVRYRSFYIASQMIMMTIF